MKFKVGDIVRHVSNFKDSGIVLEVDSQNNKYIVKWNKITNTPSTGLLENRYEKVNKYYTKLGKILYKDIS